MPAITVIRNPASGRGKHRRNWDTIERQLKDLGADILTTQHPGHASELAAKCEGAVIAAGGDGTINEVLNGISSSSALGLIPMGTGNDLCRSLGITRENAVAVIREQNSREIDVWRWSTEQREGIFLNVAGCGFDAQVAERINRGVKWLTGTPAYLCAVLATLVRFKPESLTLTIGDEQIESRVMLCALANARCYGGGMMVAPEAELDDGLLDVVLVRALGKLAFIAAFPKVFSGKHLSHPAVSVLRVKELEIASDRPMPVLADGELVGTTPLRVCLAPEKRQVLVPRTETCR